MRKKLLAHILNTCALINDVIAVVVLAIMLCVVLLGGSIRITVNWSSLQSLIHHLKK